MQHIYDEPASVGLILSFSFFTDCENGFVLVWFSFLSLLVTFYFSKSN